jgi:carbon storage regulator
MLVLTRRKDEEIFIDGGISVRVLKIEGGQVRLGVEAPKETVIMRGELMEGWRDERKHDQ